MRKVIEGSRILALGITLACVSVPAIADSTESERQHVRDFVERYSVPQVPPPDLVPIVEALQQNRLDDAERISSELIAREQRLFRSVTEASWIKSEAHRYLAEIRFRKTGDIRQEIELLKPAAEAGNLRATKKIAESMWRKAEGQPEYASVDASPEELAKFLKIGAELGDSMSAVMLGASNAPVEISEGEKIYWRLIGLALAIHDTLEFRRRMLTNSIAHTGEARVKAALSEHSLLPPTTPAGPGRLPGRGVVATLYADATLRRDYGFSYGRRGTEGGRTGPSPATLEIFKGLQSYANVAGDIRAFLLVAGDRQFEDPALISLHKGELAETLGPSDTVFVRCGSLAHVAMVHHIDRVAGMAYLSDGLWQFWQPSHNSCMSRFELVPFQHGGFLAAVPMSDLREVLEAVATFRDPPPTP